MTDEISPKRLVTPRRWALAGTVAGMALSAVAPVGLSLVAARPAMAQEAAASEAGEAGESAVALTEGPAAYLTELGLFEAAHRIVGALYAQGWMALAREHLEASHHAYYEDLVEDLEKYGAPGFEEAAQAFADAVEAGAGPEKVAAAEARVLEAIEAARASSGASPADALMSMKDLVAVAAADYASGVEEGAVTLGQEYRDAWGFIAVVRAQAEHLAASPEPARAKAGTDVLAQLDALAPLFPGLTATEAGGDPTLIPAASAWIEIIALRLD